jgi:hypothetical protein
MLKKNQNFGKKKFFLQNFEEEMHFLYSLKLKWATTGARLI